MRKAARRIVEKLRLHGQEAFFAGGWVRDFLLRRKPKDIDIATSALPDEVIRLFPNSRAIGAQFGVVQVVLYGRAAFHAATTSSAMMVASSCVRSEVGASDVSGSVVGASVVGASVVGASVVVSADESSSDPHPAPARTSKLSDTVATAVRR